LLNASLLASRFCIDQILTCTDYTSHIQKKDAEKQTLSMQEILTMSDQFRLQTFLDPQTLTQMLHAAEIEAKQLGLPPAQTGTKELGPFAVSWELTGELRKRSGAFFLKPPDAFGLQDVLLDYTFKGNFSVDLNAFKPALVSLPDLPTLPITLNLKNTLPLSGAIALHPHQNTEKNEWLIDVQVVDPFNLPMEEAASFVEQVGKTLHAELQNIPAVGTLIEDLEKAILSVIETEQVQKFLQPLLHPFVSGFTLYRLPRCTSLALQLPSPFQVNVHVNAEILELSVVPRFDCNALAFTCAGTVLIKLAEAGLSLLLAGETSLQLRLSGSDLDQRLSSHVAFRHEFNLTCDVALSTSS
jgi:hypothetical protein